MASRSLALLLLASAALASCTWLPAPSLDLPLPLAGFGYCSLSLAGTEGASAGALTFVLGGYNTNNLTASPYTFVLRHRGAVSEGWRSGPRLAIARADATLACQPLEASTALLVTCGGYTASGGLTATCVHSLVTLAADGTLSWAAWQPMPVRAALASAMGVAAALICEYLRA